MDEDIFPSFDLDVDGILEVIRSNGYHKILLQVPEGLKMGVVQFAGCIERDTEAQALIDGELCYGACDHAGTRARLLEVDAVIHLGHSKIPSMESECNIPVHFFHTPMKLPDGMIEKGLRRILKRDGSPAFGLTAPIQHVDHLKELYELLNQNGRRAMMGEPSRREEFPGQVLGCSFSSPRCISNQVNAFIYLGTGRFHPIGMVSAVKKKVWALDPMTGEVTEYGQGDLDGFLRKRFSAITSARDAIEGGKRVGVIVGTKPGQMRKGLAEKALRACDEEGANCSMIVMDHIDPMKLRSLGIELAVITACPRIAYDDIYRYIAEKVIVITHNELLIALGMEDWESYSFDEDW